MEHQLGLHVWAQKDGKSLCVVVGAASSNFSKLLQVTVVARDKVKRRYVLKDAESSHISSPQQHVWKVSQRNVAVLVVGWRLN